MTNTMKNIWCVSISHQEEKEKSRFILKYKMGVCDLASSTNKVVIFHNITDILYSCIPILNYVNLWIYLLYLNHIIKSILYSYESICFVGIHIKFNWFHEYTLCVYLTVGGKSTGVQEYQIIGFDSSSLYISYYFMTSTSRHSTSCWQILKRWLVIR